MITIAALLGLGAVTLLSLQSELVSSGQGRFQVQALYAAESGVAAGIDYLRNSCSATDLFTTSVSASNSDPPKPSQILGNGKRTGQAGNLFSSNVNLWYEVEILNNVSDTGFVAGSDNDGIVILRATGHGPDNATAIVEVEVLGQDCVNTFCATEFAQRNISALNDANAVCSTRVDATTTTRTLTPGAP